VEWSVFSPSSFFVKRKIQERQSTLLRYEGIADYAEGLPEQTAKASLCVRAGIRKRLAVDESMGLSGGICVKYLVLPDTANLRMEHAFSWTPYLGATNRFSLGVELFRLDLGRAKAEPDIEEQEEVESPEEPTETDEETEETEETEEAVEEETQEEPEQEEQTQEDPRY
jgi:TATA-binding protein-associated factor Taf7